MCAAKIYTKRAEEITAATTQWRDSGGYVYMVTCTLAHEWTDDLKVLRQGLGKAWSAVWQGREGQARVARLRKVHHVRAIEVTHGQNGFHPHIHALLFLDKELTDDDRQELSNAFRDSVSKLCGPKYSPNVEHGCRVDDSHRTDYIAKLGLEIAAITNKSGKNGNRTMWQVASDAANGDADSSRIWYMFVRAMFGARQLCWSKGARRYFGLHKLTDEQIASDEIPIDEPLGVAVTLAQWDGQSWDANASRDKYWTSKVIEQSLRGAAGLVMLPGQGTAPLQPGHVPRKREKLKPIAWRRDTSKHAFELTPEMLAKREQEGQSIRQQWRDYCFANGIPLQFDYRLSPKSASPSS